VRGGGGGVGGGWGGGGGGAVGDVVWCCGEGGVGGVGAYFRTRLREGVVVVAFEGGGKGNRAWRKLGGLVFY